MSNLVVNQGTYNEDVNITNQLNVTLQQGPISFGSLAGMVSSAVINISGITLTVGSDNHSTSFLSQLTGTGGIVKAGTGTFILAGADSYTGSTTVNAGTLIIGTAGLSSSVTINGGDLASIGGATPISVGAVTVNNGGSLGSISTAGIIDSGTLSLQAGSDFDVLIPVTTPANFSDVNVTGSATINGATLNLAATSGLANGTYTILTASTGIMGTFVGLPQNSLITANGEEFEINYTADAVSLTLMTNIVYVSATWAGDAAGTNVTDPVLTDGVNAVIGVNAFASVNAGIAAANSEVIVNPGAYAESVVSGPQPIAMTLQGGDISFTSITDSVTNALTLTVLTSSTATVDSGALNGEIGGSGNLEVAGPGTLTLLGNNSYTGTTTIDASGVLRIGDGGTATSIASGSIIDNGSLLCDSSGTLTVAGSISGAGSVTQEGAGTLILTGVNTYTGNTFISEGTLQAGSPTTEVLSPSSPVSVADSATLDFTGGNETIASLSGAGTITNSAPANTTILTVGGAGNLSSTFSGVIQDGAGIMALIKAGTGTLTLAGDNTFSGATAINSGSLFIAGADPDSSVTIFGGTLASLGGTTPATVGSVTAANQAPSARHRHPGSSIPEP